jgi:hypothetical protein
MPRKTLPHRRPQITQKISIAGRRTIYASVDRVTDPSEMFIRVKEKNLDPEIVTAYDVIARLISLALQYDVPTEAIGQSLVGSKCEPSGPVSGHERIKFCNSPFDYLGRHILVECCGQDEHAHIKKETAS